MCNLVESCSESRTILTLLCTSAFLLLRTSGGSRLHVHWSQSVSVSSASTFSVSPKSSVAPGTGDDNEASISISATFKRFLALLCKDLSFDGSSFIPQSILAQRPTAARRGFCGGGTSTRGNAFCDWERMLLE